MKQQYSWRRSRLAPPRPRSRAAHRWRSKRPTIVLVHGASWTGPARQGVYKLLRKDGYTVRVVQNPTISLAGDVAATRLIVDAQEGRVLLVGHSYAARSSRKRERSLRSRACLHHRIAPDKGESVNSLIKDPPPGAPVPPILPAPGRLLVPRPYQIRCIVRGGRERGDGRIHGRVAGPVGR